MPSRLISRHHWMHVNPKINKPNRKSWGLKMWNHFTIPDVKIKAPKAPVNGQGLWSTK